MTASSPPVRRSLGIALLMLVASGAALVIAEVAVRIIAPLNNSIYEPDSIALYRLAAGSRKVMRRRDPPVLVEVDSQGFRGRDFAPRTSARRLAVFGDSFIAAEFSSLEETFVEQLRLRVGEQLQDSVEAINVGVAGYGPDQSLRRMSRDLARLSPDLIVLAVFPFNDFGDLLRNKLLRVDSAGALVDRGGRLSPSWSAELSSTAHPSGWRRSLIVRHLERALEERERAQRARARGPLEEFTAKALRVNDSTYVAAANLADSLVGNETFRDEYDADIAIRPDAPSARYKVALMGATLRAIRDEAARRNTPLLLVVIPAPEDICPGYARHADSTAYPTYVRSRLTDVTERLAHDAGIAVVNLWPAFSAANPCTLYFAKDDNHWNAAGQALAARVVADSTRAHGWPPAARTRGSAR